MTQKECEYAIAELLEEIVEVYKEYNPQGNYLDLVFSDNGIYFCNKYYREDKLKPIDFLSWDWELNSMKEPRRSCENQIAGILLQIICIYKEYNPQGDYLDLTFINNHLFVNNAYFKEDKERPINIRTNYEEN